MLDRYNIEGHACVSSHCTEVVFLLWYSIAEHRAWLLYLLTILNAQTVFYREAYAIGKKEKPPFLPEEPSSSSEEDDPIPDELLCLICKDIMTDAVVIPCCGNSYCDECKRLGPLVKMCLSCLDGCLFLITVFFAFVNLLIFLA
jgi:hypothetical protein